MDRADYSMNALLNFYFLRPDWPPRKRGEDAMSVKAACLLLVFLFCWTLTATAQIDTGSLVGTTVDPSGAVVPGATITLLSETTGARRTATTDDRGNFEFNAVPSGTYTVIADPRRFKKF